MKYKVNDVIRLKEDLELSSEESNVNMYERVFPVEHFFRGFNVKVVKTYPEWGGYGVKHFGSREFFVHESHIEEV